MDLKKSDYFQLFNWFQLISSEKQIPSVAGNGQNKSKIYPLKGGVDGFSIFSLIFSYFGFLPESSLKIANKTTYKFAEKKVQKVEKDPICSIRKKNAKGNEF